jgi:hypothetical protein
MPRLEAHWLWHQTCVFAPDRKPAPPGENRVVMLFHEFWRIGAGRSRERSGRAAGLAPTPALAISDPR